jgi:L-asparaginase / beta-aspartyl-peptidase
MAPPQSWSLVLHGGSGRITPELVAGDGAEAARRGLARALDAGAALLAAGTPALDAVEAAVRVLEEEPSFNAGRGAVLTAEGRIELDAAIMGGATLAAGAVAGVTRTRHPVTLARAVMERSPHVLLARDGADRFALDHGLEQVDSAWFELPERRRQLEELLARGDAAFDADLKYGTVGAVARDAAGHLAAATSTGGLTAKRWGRVGDSPLVGAGTYADDRAVAVSCTGTGEVFIRLAAAHEIAARIRLAGAAPLAAAEAVMAEVGRLGGTGGVIAVGRDGPGGWAFISPGMFRARADGSGGREIAMYGA